MNVIKYIQTSGEKAFWKVTTWKIKKEVGG